MDPHPIENSKLFFGKLSTLLALLALAILVVPSLADRMASQEILESEELLAAVAKISKEGLIQSKEIRGINDEILRLNTAVARQKGTQRDETIATMQTKARARKEKLLQLMEEDPVAALQAVIPSSRSRRLPAEVRTEVEKLTVSEGETSIRHIDNFGEKKSRDEYFLQKNGGVQKLVLAGDPSALSPRASIQIRGYQLENRIIASPGALKILAEPTPIPSDTTGTRRVIVFLINFQDSPPTPAAREAIAARIFDSTVQKFFREASYDQLRWTGEVTDWYTLPRTAVQDGRCVWPIDVFHPTLLFDQGEFSQILKGTGVNLDGYQHVIFVGNHPCLDRMAGGIAYVGKVSFNLPDGKIYTTTLAWTSTPSFYNPFPFAWSWFDTVVSHEIGHGLGVVHANVWYCSLIAQDRILYGNGRGRDCNHLEYWNPFDVMGFGLGSGLHFNAMFKEIFGWLDPASLVIINHSGQYHLESLESSTGLRGAKIRTPDGETPFYLEYRRPFGFDQNIGQDQLLKGLLINWRYHPRATRLLLLRRTGYTYIGTESPLGIGQSFTDSERKITIGPILTADENGITFYVTFGPLVYDLQISDLRTTPAPAVLQPFTVQARIRNGGTTPITGTTFDLSFTNLPGVFLKDKTPDPSNTCNDDLILSPGEQCTIAYRVTLFSKNPLLPRGKVILTVDPKNTIQEADEGNNSASLEIGGRPEL